MPISASELEDSKPGKKLQMHSSAVEERTSHEPPVESHFSVSHQVTDKPQTEKKQPLNTNSLEAISLAHPPDSGNVPTTENPDTKSNGSKKKLGSFYHHPYSLVSLAQLDAILPLSASHSPVSYKEQLIQVGKILFLDSYPETIEDQGKKASKAYRQMLISMLVVILILTGSLIPSFYFAIKGSTLSFWNHFNSLSSMDRAKTANELGDPRFYALSTGTDTIAHAQTLKGVTYSPMVSRNGECINSMKKVTEDMLQISLITSKVRTYTTECNLIDYMVFAIEHFNLDVKIALGIWISNDESENAIHIEKAKNLLQKYHPRHFDQIFVGNEVLFRNDLSHNALVNHINDFKQFLQSMLLKIPVGTSEIDHLVNEDLMRETQVIGINVHPYLTGLGPREASKWVVESLEKKLKTSHKYGTLLIISEIGWPYDGEASSIIKENLQVYEFMDAWVCHDGMRHNLTWFYFEAFDQPLGKRKFYGRDRQWEADWGIFDVDKKLKPGIVLPTCHN